MSVIFLIWFTQARPKFLIQILTNYPKFLTGLSLPNIQEPYPCRAGPTLPLITLFFKTNDLPELGWTGDLCDVPICRKGCDPLQGYCRRPGECRCKLGFYGDLCDKCVALPGCQYGRYFTNALEREGGREKK